MEEAYQGTYQESKADFIALFNWFLLGGGFGFESLP